MKLRKSQLALLVLTVLFVTFTMAFFLGRGSVRTMITTQTSPEVQAERAAAKEVPNEWRLEINQAEALDFETLPGIGPVLAERIVQWREANGPFTDISQLVEVEGIGRAKLEVIKPYIYLEEQHEDSGRR